MLIILVKYFGMLRGALLFIGETIGWQELLLIGMLALIFLGPRRLPKVAKTFGKAMAELRRAGQEFKKTWEKEVALEEEEKRFLQNPFDESLILAEERYSKANMQKDNSESFIPSKEIELSSKSKSLSSQKGFVRRVEQKEKEIETSEDLNKDKTVTINSKQNWL
ncbi:MAG: twin-arginine translocase subunit TatB [Acidobacteria bacterium]|jgi:sec-independent protein translocase protein TatB|nr:MAG: twin-arginine translocase subunit TatB [Acidobacteriota bacterium]GIU82371.1 MAG: hypothetical protein KatS3mg006_1435 [Pyrinomonadaceae bacterium]